MENRKTAVALGLFDGVHLGHRAVLRLVAESGFVPSVFTFNAETVNDRKSGAGYIYSDYEKTELLRSCGIENIRSVSFGDVCNMSGEEFVKNILVDGMEAAFVSCGKSFRFGKGAACGVGELRELGRKYGFDVSVPDDVTSGGDVVSSTSVRSLITGGEIEKAAAFLGGMYTIRKEVVHGAQLGRTIGFPTINQIFEGGQLVPKYGVYASEVIAGGRSYIAMTNIGMKPTVNYDGLPLAETHIIDFSGDIYGEIISVSLVGFVRPEKKFRSVEELRRQISADLDSIKNSSKIRDNIINLSRK